MMFGSILYDCKYNWNLTSYSYVQKIEKAEYVAQLKRKEKGPFYKDTASMVTSLPTLQYMVVSGKLILPTDRSHEGIPHGVLALLGEVWEPW